MKAILSSTVAAILSGVVCAGAAGLQRNAVNVNLPQGDPQQGRRAFTDLKCTACHRVAGETQLPAPVSENQGPTLDSTLAMRPAAELAAAIIAPSHSMSVKTSNEVRERLRNMHLSPMPDYTRAMTVRQLADLLAYLGSLGRSK